VVPILPRVRIVTVSVAADQNQTVPAAFRRGAIEHTVSSHVPACRASSRSALDAPRSPPRVDDEERHQPDVMKLINQAQHPGKYE
jgi:hypothetical protein